MSHVHEGVDNKNMQYSATVLSIIVKLSYSGLTADGISGRNEAPSGLLNIQRYKLNSVPRTLQ